MDVVWQARDAGSGRAEAGQRLRPARGASLRAPQRERASLPQCTLASSKQAWMRSVARCRLRPASGILRAAKNAFTPASVPASQNDARAELPTGAMPAMVVGRRMAKAVSPGRMVSPRAATLAGVDLEVYPAGDAFATLIVAHGAGAGQTSPFHGTSRGRSRRARYHGRDVRFSLHHGGTERSRSGARARGRVARGDRRGAHPDRGADRSSSAASPWAGGSRRTWRRRVALALLAGLVFFGYPLHPPGKPDQRRDAHLPAIGEPMLFIQGSRDPFGTGDEIRALPRRCSTRRCTRSPAAITRSRCQAGRRSRSRRSSR